ncbi:MAG: hypothetical protein F4Z04_14420 [Acidobacteria bacterium]|nr:hypothetical protein [Acidobacteriota bacterium]
MAADLRPYPDYKDSGMEWLGKVPAHWRVASVKRHYAIRLGKMLQPGRRGSEDCRVPYLKAKHVQWFEVRANDIDTMWATPAEVDRYGVAAGDLLVCEGGEGGRSGLVKLGARLPDSCIIQNALHRVRPRSGCVVGDTGRNDYLQYVMSTIASLRWFDVLTDKATIAHFTAEKFGALPVPVPPSTEQAAIVRFLDHIDRRIRRYIRAKQKLIALLEESRTVLINHAVTQGLNPNADTHSTRSHVFPFVPRDWTLRRMRSLVQRVRRPISVRPDTEYREIGIRSWGKGIFHKDSVPGAVLGEKNVFRIEPGDFVLNIVFAWEGAVAVVSENETGMIASHRFPTFRPSSEVDVDYLLIVFQSEQGRRLMEVNSPGAAGRNRTLRIGQFLEEEIPLPTLDAQRAIVAAFRDGQRRLADCVARTRQAVHEFEGFRSRLIADVVTGKLDVREAAARLLRADPPSADGEFG